MLKESMPLPILNKNRKTFSRFTPSSKAWRTAAVVLGLFPAFLPAQKAPNIVFIHSDDHRQDLFSFAGHPHLETPNLDRLAAEGAHFPNAFTTSGTCSPARAAFWTGRYPHRASAPNITHQNNSFLETQTTFPMQLQQAGYETAHVGKWHLGRDDQPQRGFDIWYGWERGVGFNQVFIKNGTERIETEGFADDANTDIAVDLIEDLSRDRDQPFFLSVGLRSPHRPFAYPDRLEDKFADDTIPPPSTFDENYAESGRDPHIQRVSIIHKSNSPFYRGFRGWDNYIKSHYRAAFSIDENVGRILDALEEAGIADDTIVIYTSDHGYNLGEHGLVEKHFPHEHIMRVPLILRWPGKIQPGTAPEAMVSHLDLAPSLLRWVGAEVPEGLDGVDLSPLMREPEKTPAGWRDAVFFNFESRDGRIPGQNAFRTEDFKLIRSDRNHLELYDLRNDPEETRNVAQDPAYAATLREMQQRNAAMMDAIGYRPRPTRTELRQLHVLRGLSEEDALAISDQLSDRALNASAPALPRDRSLRWETVEARPDGSFPVEAIASQDDELTLIAFTVERLTDYDPHLAIWIAPWPETTLFWRGRELWTYERHAGNLCNPPLASPENTVLIGLRDVSQPISILWESMADSVEIR